MVDRNHQAINISSHSGINLVLFTKYLIKMVQNEQIQTLRGQEKSTKVLGKMCYCCDLDYLAINFMNNISC